MQQRTKLIVNSFANVSARLVTLAAAFVIIPFAIGVMGRSAYGTWIIVGQLFGYTRFLESGLRASVMRQVAMRIARGEHDLLNRYVNTAGAYFFTVGLLIAVLTVVLAVFFPDWFDVQPDHRTSARVMVIIAGLALACTVPTYAYVSIAAGLQRYDIIAGTQMAADVLRLVLILLLLEHVGIAGGMILLAVAAGGCTLLGALARTVMSFRLWKEARFRPWRPELTLLRGMVGFGVNTVLFVVSVSAVSQFAQIMIGALMSTAQATDFRLAMELILGANALIIACVVGIAPAASKYHGEQNTAALKQLFVRSTRYVAVLALVAVVGLTAFSPAFLALWQGDNYAGVEGAQTLARIAKTCRILVIGHGLFWLMLPAFQVINGIGRNRVPAGLALATGTIAMVLVLTLSLRQDAEIDHVAWGVVLPIIPAWAVLLPLYCCRVVGESVVTFLWRGFGIPLVGCLPACLLALVLARFYPAASWWALLGQIAACGVVLIPFGWWIVAIPDDRSHIVASLRGAFRRFSSRKAK